MAIDNEDEYNHIPVLPSDDDDDLSRSSPFGQLGLDLSDVELRETAYEVFVASCRSSGGKPLTFISQSERAPERLPSMSSVPSLQRTLTSVAASKLKKALGLKSSKKNLGKEKKPLTIGELMRVQMGISEPTDSRIRRALLRVAAGQLGRRIESMVLPLELLQQLKSSDFPSQREFEDWQKRNLKILEAGLLLHPYFDLGKTTDTSQQQLRQIIRGVSSKPLEIGKHSEQMKVLRSAVTSLACRSFNGSVSDTCHWADGAPLNLVLYQTLLEACFDANEQTNVIEEVDEVIELLKKTWPILGVNQMLHNLCFCWVLFRRFVATGQVENDLLFAAHSVFSEVEKDVKETKDLVYSKVLSSTLHLILDWSERRLLAYYDSFHGGNLDLMQTVLSMGVSSAKMLVEDVAHEYRRRRKDGDVARERVDTYIRSSIRGAFSQEMEKLKSSRKTSRNQQNPLPVLSVLAQSVHELAFSEKERYSPVLKPWHPLAAGIAVATLHTCYANELKQFVSSISELTPDTVQVLIAADKLEKDLVHIAVEDSVDSDDGGKAVIREMTPYEAEAMIGNLVKSWINTRLGRLKEWVDRNLQQEVWDPRANKERFAPSAVEVLRIMDETLEAFFLLPIPMHPNLFTDLISGLDTCLQQYILKAKSGCGSRSSFTPTIPGLTRCKPSSKLHGVFKRKDKSNVAQRRKPQVGTLNGDNSSSGIPQLCVRINTMQHIRKALEVLEKRAITHLRTCGLSHVDDIVKESGKRFELSATACGEGIQELCEATAYKVVFHDLSPVLWDSLYVGEFSAYRIEPFLLELEHNLEMISATVHDRVRTRLITDVMKASFEGFLLVLLAGGPSRAFTQKDSELIDEDFQFLAELFWSNGDGLPLDLIDKLSTTAKGVLSLFRSNTENLIEKFKSATLECYGSSSAKSGFPLPPTTGQWGPTEPNTLLRVLCHRSDEVATKFLKKTYNLPKKL